MASTVTDFLRSKWKNAFHTFDTNKDGILTVDDYIGIADKISQKTGASPEQAENSRREWSKYFDFYQPDPSIIVDVNRFVNTLEEMIEKDVKHFKELHVLTAIDVFDRIDHNGDGLISPEEFSVFYEAIGIYEKDITTKHFQKIDHNGDGWIQRDEFVDEVVRCFADPNPQTGISYLFPNYQE